LGDLKAEHQQLAMDPRRSPLWVLFAHPSDGIRSERRLCEEVYINLAYRWFCRLGLDGHVPDHSTFSKNRHGRFRESDLLRRVFEIVLGRCIREGLVGGEAFAVHASLIKADANRQNPVGTAGRRRYPVSSKCRRICRS
jgi:Transposase domain (DUF772)